jgi:phosphonoacetate hydrolase
VLLTADHGSEGADPGCVGDWAVGLRAARVPFRDEAYGFLYLGEDVAPQEPGNRL